MSTNIDQPNPTDIDQMQIVLEWLWEQTYETPDDVIQYVKALFSLFQFKNEDKEKIVDITVSALQHLFDEKKGFSEKEIDWLELYKIPSGKYGIPSGKIKYVKFSLKGKKIIPTYIISEFSVNDAKKNEGIKTIREKRWDNRTSILGKFWIRSGISIQ